MLKTQRFGFIRVAAAAALLFGAVVSCEAQAASTLQGRADDATGQPLRNAVVRLITDHPSSATGGTWRYRLVVDEAGNFGQGGIAPGSYTALLFADGKGVEISEHVVLRGGEAKVVNFGPSDKKAAGKAASMQAVVVPVRGRNRTQAR